jgi:hypothetical protein
MSNSRIVSAIRFFELMLMAQSLPRNSFPVFGDFVVRG